MTKYFSSLFYQISMTTNLNSPVEKLNTHRTMPLQLWPVLPKKKIDWPSPNSTTPLFEPIAASQTGFETNLMLKNSTTEIALSLSSSLPKSSSPHPRTGCSSMGGLRQEHIACFHANAYVWEPEDIVQLSRVTISSVRHYISYVSRHEITKRSIWNPE